MHRSGPMSQRNVDELFRALPPGDDSDDLIEWDDAVWPRLGIRLCYQAKPVVPNDTTYDPVDQESLIVGPKCDDVPRPVEPTTFDLDPSAFE